MNTNTIPGALLEDIVSHPAVAYVRVKLSPVAHASAKQRIVYTMHLLDGWYLPGLLTPLTATSSYDLPALAADLLQVTQVYDFS